MKGRCWSNVVPWHGEYHKPEERAKSVCSAFEYAEGATEPNNGVRLCMGRAVLVREPSPVQQFTATAT